MIEPKIIKNHGSGYPGNDDKQMFYKHPWKHKSGGFLAKSMKQQSMNENAKQMTDWVEKFQMTRNTISINFVIQPGKDDFSNCKQSPKNDSWGDDTHSFDRTRHLGPIFYGGQSISLIWKFKFQPSKMKKTRPDVMRLVKSVCSNLVRPGQGLVWLFHVIDLNSRSALLSSLHWVSAFCVRYSKLHKQGTKYSITLAILWAVEGNYFAYQVSDLNLQKKIVLEMWFDASQFKKKCWNDLKKEENRDWHPKSDITDYTVDTSASSEWVRKILTFTSS